MTSDEQHRFEVRHLADEFRYVLIDHAAQSEDAAVIGEERYRDFDNDGSTQRILYHTEVSEDYGGQGLASTLVKAVVEDIAASGHAIVPVCPYVAKWLPKHPEFRVHVVQPTMAHLRAVSA